MTTPTDIRDPYAGTPDDFRRCYTLIENSCEGFLGSIVGRASDPSWTAAKSG